MSARLARTAFQSATRRAQTAASSARVSRRTMSSSTAHDAAKSSDTPWIVGSLLIFGPLFLYLVSPSARKNTPTVHNDQHDYPNFHPHDAPAAKAVESPAAEDKPADPATPEVIMKDDEGTPANVGSSLALSEAHDAPKASQTPEDQAKLRTEAESAPAPSSEDKPAQSEATETPKSGTYQKEDEEGPTNMSKARESAQEGVEPKKAAEAEN